MNEHIYLPAHDFYIGENEEAHVDQLPDFGKLVAYAAGRGPIFTHAFADTRRFDAAPWAVGLVAADACLKLLRPCQPLAETVASDPLDCVIDDIADTLSKPSRAFQDAQFSFFCRIEEFMKIGLLRPGCLATVTANIDLLTNARLTERMRAILTTGIDPGQADLWQGWP